MKEQQVFGVQPIKQKYVNAMGACFYTGKTPDQLDYAVKKGYLRARIARDGSKSYAIPDLDAFMDSDENQAS
jgi:hypothetical protein